MAYINCKDLTIGYDGKIVAQNINFCVNEGDYLCVVGENGVGKSTLLKTLLKQKNPLMGQMVWDNDIKRNEIGYLPQQSAQKDFPASVKEVVSSGCQNGMGWRPFLTGQEKQMINLNMQKLDIKELRDRCYRELSGGQQQRVLLARALCATKKILFLDEPTVGLDPKITLETYQIINRIHKEGITIVMISHDVNTALNFATHILHLHPYQSFFGTKEDYLKTEMSRNFVGDRGEKI